MKKITLSCLSVVICLMMAGILFAQEIDIREIPACKYCGMNREMYAHSRILINYEDGSKVGLCSLHCAAVDMALNIDKTPASIHVGDYGTKGLTNVETAVWVIGGGKPGVMTKNAKWAFADKADAEKFQGANGGRLAAFDDALQASYEDLGNDTKMIRERRKMKRMKMNMEHKH